MERACETNTDLVMIGTHEAVGRTRFLLGSVAKIIVRLAPCSVELVRCSADEEAGFQPLKVLLATDGSDFSAVAVRSIAARPWPAGTEARILSVVETTVPLFCVPCP